MFSVLNIHLISDIFLHLFQFHLLHTGHMTVQGHALRVFCITVTNLIGQILKACTGNMTTSVRRHVKVRWV